MLASSTTRRAMFGLTILLVLGLVLTTQGVAQEGRPGGGAAGKKKAGPPIDGKKRYALEFDRKPWKEVVEWFADSSGLAFIGNAATLPTGTFTFVNPTVNGAKKTYTIAELVEIINDGLAPRNMLIRRNNGFRVVSAGDEFDKELISQVTREELAKRGGSEIVILEVQLKTLEAEELAPEAKKFLGEFSEVTPLPATNGLILMGKVERLRRWLEITEEGCTPGGFETYQHACEYVKASQAEKALRDLLGDPEKSRSYHIASDDRTNTIYVNGPPEKVERAKQLIAKFDVPQYGGPRISLTAPTFKTYSIPAGNADAIAKILTDVYKTSATLRFTATSGTVLLVFGLPLEQMEIAALLKVSPVTPANSPDDVVRFAKGPPRFGRTLRRCPGTSRSSLEARLDRLIVEVEAIRREVRGRR